jgi:hypothetical protein
MVHLWLVASILYPAVEALATELAIRCSRMDGVAQVTVFFASTSRDYGSRCVAYLCWDKGQVHSMTLRPQVSIN